MRGKKGKVRGNWYLLIFPEKINFHFVNDLHPMSRAEKARLQAEAKAAEDARKQAEAEAAAEAKRKRELEREAARQALLQVSTTLCLFF